MRKNMRLQHFAAICAQDLPSGLWQMRRTVLITMGRNSSCDATKVVTFQKVRTHINLKVNPQIRPLKGSLLLFVEAYAADSRDTEKYINPQCHGKQRKISDIFKSAPGQWSSGGKTSNSKNLSLKHKQGILKVLPVALEWVRRT